MNVDLMCKSCTYRGKSVEEMKNHSTIHCHLKCSKCEFTTDKEDELVVHEKNVHLGVDMRFTCNICSFKAEYLVEIYEHKLSNHPGNPMDFNPNRRSAKDMALNLIAEQNIDLIEEIQDLKKTFKSAFEQLANDVRNSIGETTKAAFLNIDKKIANLEKKREKKQINESDISPTASSTTAPLPSTKHPRTAPEAPPKAASEKRKKTKFLQKPKILYIGDSIAQNADVAGLEIETQSRIKSKKAYSSINDRGARWPQKNFIDITPAALAKTHEGDEFSYLVLAAPSVDITNMDTSKLTVNDNTEIYKQNIAISCQNMFTVANNAIRSQPSLKKVIIMEHAPRHDMQAVDLTGLKPKLAKYANETLAQLLHNSPMKDRIVVGRHSLDCSEHMFNARFKDDWSGKHDGVHMYGSDGKRAYTESVMRIFKSVLPSSQNSASSSFSHYDCPQTKYQKMKMSNSGNQSNRNVYTVPVSNKFNVLGN